MASPEMQHRADAPAKAMLLGAAANRRAGHSLDLFVCKCFRIVRSGNRNAVFAKSSRYMHSAFTRTSNGGQGQSFGHRRSSGEMKMSMFENFGRLGVTIRQAHARKKSIRALNSLPAHVQKDIGWPASPPNDPQATLASLLLGSTR
ncbi:hypothetical protein NKI51_11945 [Mesorhizobium australicum]|uniref:hypothetical protein n=2 Tax=Mesorhizobium australicum TaxID=536018 RepID=UPI00333A5062